MASARSANLNKSILLVILMITMSQVGYLESMNPWTSGEETLDDAEPIAQSSPATSVMYGNNSTWTPQGPMLTSGYHSSSAIIAVSDEVILFKYQEGYNGDYCLAAYNRYNETSWTPTFNTPIGDDCSDTSGGFEFLGMIGNTTLFTFDEDVGNQNHNHYKGHSIYAYNFDNDTVYRLYRATTLTYQYESEHRDPVMIGNSVYFLEYYITASNNKFRLGVFNFDNQTHWTYHSSLPSNCTDKMTQLLAVSESKLLTNCGSSLYEPFLFNIKNETMYRPNGLNGVTGSIGSTNALVGTQLLFRADGNTGTGYEPWILDVSNDSAWMVEDLNPGTGSSNLANPLRSGTRVLFNINPGQYSGYPVSNFYWYESSNNTIWQATTFTDTVATIGDVAELANGVIVFTTHKTNVHKTKFYNPANGSVWEEPAMCVGKHGSNCDSGRFDLKAVYGNTIFGSVPMNATVSGNSQTVRHYRMMAYDLSNNSVQVSWGLGNAGAPSSSACMATNAFVFGDQVMYPWRGGPQSGCWGKVNNGSTTTSFATMIWSPSAIRVSDAWNMSKGDLIETGDPLSGGVGTRYNSGAGIQNLTASVEGADLSVDVPMTNITFQYNASAASGGSSGSGSSSSSSFAYANDKAATGLHTCAILDNGDLKCWGFDGNGQLGDGGSTNTNTNVPSSTAIDLGTGRTAVAASARGDHTCAILDNGDLKCWGRDNEGQLGDGGTNANTNAPSSTAIDLGTGRTAVAVSAGSQHTCAILDNGDLKCWGEDNYGQLGDGGSNTNTNGGVINTIDLGTGRTAVAVSAGDDHTCAILDNGDLKCWGSDAYGQLGDGGTTHTSSTYTTEPSSTAIDLGTGRTAVAVSAGDYLTCAILDNGDLKCWGRGDYGQLGDGGTNTNTNAPSSTPIDLGTGRTAVAVSAGYYHTCAILDNGDMKCWGYGGKGQLGDGGTSDTNAPSSTPIDLGTGRTAVAVSAGDWHTCAILDNGDMKCWGQDGQGQLGDAGTNTNQASPVAVSGSNTWDSTTGLSSPMTNVTGATCTVSPSLPTGLSIDSSTCTISGTPTVTTSNATYTITAVINSVTYQTTVWLSISPFATITSAVEGAHLNLREAMTPISLNYTSQAGNAYFYNGNGTEWLVKSFPSNYAANDMNRPHHMVAFKGEAYFGGNNGTYGAELWKSDGTTSGTRMVKDTRNGAGNGFPNSLTVVNDTLYFFTSYNGNTCPYSYPSCTFNHSLWKSDGTEAGTVFIKDVDRMPGGTTNDWRTNAPIHAIGDTIFFWGSDGPSDGVTHGIELWKSDGTASGTVMVKDINPGSTSSDSAILQYRQNQMIVTGNTLYFIANDGTHGYELWKSDGTASGTVMVKDINNGTDSMWHSSMRFAAVGNTVYFQANDGTNGTELWKSDGTASGTVMVKDIESGSDSGNAHVLTSNNNTLFFFADDGTNGAEFWKSDGTASGTVMVKDINTGTDNWGGSLCGTSNRNMLSVNNTIYFLARHTPTVENTDCVMWASDGTTAGTHPLTYDDPYWGTIYFEWWGFNGQGESMTNMYQLGDSMYFRPIEEIHPAFSTGWFTTSDTNRSEVIPLPDVCWDGATSTSVVLVGNTIFAQKECLLAGDTPNDNSNGLMAYDPMNITIHTPPPVSWETHPALPAGMSISGGTISGTPSVYANNQTYTIYANQSGNSTTHELYFSVDTDNAHTVVENQTIDAIGFHPPFNNGTTCWTVSPALPGNLSMDTSTGEITGSVNGTLTNTTYTVTANHGCSGSGSGGSSGNGTTYVPGTPPQMSQQARVGDHFMLEHDGIIYYDAILESAYTAGNIFQTGVFAFNPANGTQWMITNQSFVNSGTSSYTNPQFGYSLASFVGDILFFSASLSIMAYDTSNQSTWTPITTINSHPGQNLEIVVGDRLYFNAGDTIEVYDTSNHSHWAAGSGVAPGNRMAILMGDNIYFDAEDTGGLYGEELYAFNTINESIWMVADIYNGTKDSNPGHGFSIAVGDTIYFSAESSLNAVSVASSSSPPQLWAHNTSNGTTYLTTDLNKVGRNMENLGASAQINWNQRHPPLIGDTFYFTAGGNSSSSYSSQFCTSGHIEIYAYNVSNQTAWCVADSGGVGWSGTAADGDAGGSMLIQVGDILFFEADTSSTQTTQSRPGSLYAHNLSNGTTWEIQSSNGLLNEVGNGFTGFTTSDTLYFTAKLGGGATGTGQELFGYNIVNHTVWLVKDICPGWCAGVTNQDFHWVDVNGVLYIPVRESNGNNVWSLGIFNPALPIASSSSSGGGSGSGGSGSGGSGSGGSTGTGATETFTFNLQSLADYDGDGLANDLPADYDAAEGPTSGLVTDTDDDADGLLDTVETNTGTYVDSSDTGTDPLNPDTDGDGICDGPIAVSGVCIAGPDTNSGATVVDTPIVLLNNSEVDEIAPFYPLTVASFAYANDKLSAGSQHTCVILDNGDLKCWGRDHNGQLGDGGTNANINAPSSTAIDLGTGRTAVAVDAGQTHTCAILDNGDLKCWGYDLFGQLGDGGINTAINAPSSTAIDLGTGRTAVAVSAGNSHTCAILDNGDLKCWGQNSYGQLGDGGSNTDVPGSTTNTDEPSSTAIDLGTGRTAVAVDTGNYYTCVILDNGDVKCWGWDNYGQLGDGGTNTNTNAPSSTAIDLGTGRTAVAISAGGIHTCAILDNGDVKCWGRDDRGQLGDGGSNTDTNAPSSTAIDLGTGRTAVAVSTGGYNTCVILDNGEAKCWGYDTLGQLGDGGSNTDTNAPSSTAIDLGTGRTAVALSTGTYHTCVILDNGDAKCWGSDGYGQVGDGGSNDIYAYQGSPVAVSGSNTWDCTICEATYGLSPALPTSMQFDASNGSIWGTPDMTMSNTTYTMWANLTDGTSTSWTIFLEVLEDLDGDGMPDVLPGDYDAVNDPIRTPGLEEDLDDDGDGYNDTAETGTGIYVDENNTGTDPSDPDTDDDGICDGPNAIAGVCIAGPDITNGPNMITTPVVLVNNSEVSEIAPFMTLSGATYALSPDLPTSMQFDASNGSIWGTPDMTMSNSTYTMWANTSELSVSWTFFLEVLEDLDGDGMPDVLPVDYDEINDPIRTPGLAEDLDDDGDGYNDTAETDTGLYLDANNTGTDPRDPDTDDDGICDGPNAVSPICIAGPDLTPFGPPATVVAVNNSMIPSVPPYYAGSGLTYEVMPDLPAGLTIDPTNGYLMGIPTETIGNTTYTVYANLTDGTSYSWDFTIEVLEDSDGDGSPDTLPSDYDGDDDSIRPPPGLTEDLDDDNDGASDLDEVANGTEPLNPDTDGDGFCDGINAVAGVCFAGPDPNPLNPNLPLDTDGDGLPDDDSAWTGPPYADDDDDNDGFPDASEDACGSDSLDANSIPADMDGDAICDGDDDDKDGDGIDNVNETGALGVPPGSSPINPDTDGDGICDGPESPVTSNCTAGPDMFPLDPSAWEDTDGDGYPNELFPPSNSTPPLEEDLDDDNDGWTDIDEVNCGTDPVNVTDIPVDLNGDGVCDVLDLDWDDDGIPNANETDTGIYNDPSDMGTDPWNPDTDGDGFCDGPFAVFNGTDTVCIGGPDPFPLDPTMPFDTDGDGLPNDLPDDYVGNLAEDLDDDGDGFSDVSELNCDSDPLDASSTPTNDLDGDGICDAQDDDVDGDGLSNATEQDSTSTSQFNNADTDGDGICDGPLAPAMPVGVCTAGPDAFPNDPAAWIDTDGDGRPDEIVPGIETDLELDLDDDNDQWSDEDEVACGTNSKNDASTPLDGDDDGICDVLDVKVLGYVMNDQEALIFEGYVNQSDFIILPNLTGMEQGTWEIQPALPAGLSFSGTARSGETGIISGIPTESSNMTNYTVYANNSQTGVQFTFELAILADTDGDGLPDEGSVTGLEEDLDDDNDGHLDEVELKCDSDPSNQTSVPNVDENNECITGQYADDDSDDSGFSALWCLPLIFLLLLVLLLLGLLLRDKVALIGPEPEYTTSEPHFLSGAGTKDDPFVLKPVKALKAGTKVEAKESISITDMSPEIVVNLLDLAEATNDKRFMMFEIDGASEEPGYRLEADEEGRLRIRFVFDDGINPTYEGGDYEGLIKLGKASVYFSWTVGVKQDKKKMKELKKQQEAEEKAAAAAAALAAKEAKAAEEKAAKEAEKKAKAEEKAAAALAAKEAKEEADAKKKADADAKAAKESEKKAKAEEKAAAAALAAKAKEEEDAKEEADAKKKADADAKAAKEAEKKAKAEEKAAAAVLAAKAKEEEDAKKKADADAKAAKEAEKKAKAEEKAAAAALAAKAKEEEDAKKKADADAKAAKEAEEKAAAAKKKAEKKPVATAKEVKKQEELQRVKKRAKSIDFKVIGEATSTKLKSEVKKGSKTLEVGDASEFADSGSAAITDSEGSTLITWTGKDGNVLTGVSGVTRIFGAASIVMVKDDLQVIKGIGPFLEEKLNALGITTYRQLANMNAKLEEQVNVAIEFFPGRVKRDQWVAQAKILLGEDVKLDEKALKQAEDLERIAQKADGIDFGILGVATIDQQDDLQTIKGIGPFIAEKLYALGIYTFEQIGNMTSEIEEEVNKAIEFFPGRVKRDEWTKQGRELHKKK